MFITAQETKMPPSIVITENHLLDNAVQGFESEPLPKDLLFFAAPPSTIGTVTNAYSTLKQDSSFLPKEGKTISQFLGVVSGLIIGYLLADFSDSTLIGYILTMVLFTLVTSFIAFYFIGSNNVYDCVYLGTNGIAHFRVIGNRNNVFQQVLIFNEDIVSQSSALNGTTLTFQDTTDCSYFWFENKYKISFEAYIFTIHGTSSHYDNSIGKMTLEKWLIFLYEQKVMKDIQEIGAYEHHSGILLYQNQFTFYHEGTTHKVNRSNLVDVVRDYVTQKIDEAECEIPYLSLKKDGKLIPITPLAAMFRQPQFYNCGLLRLYIERHLM